MVPLKKIPWNVWWRAVVLNNNLWINTTEHTARCCSKGTISNRSYRRRWWMYAALASWFTQRTRVKMVRSPEISHRHRNSQGGSVYFNNVYCICETCSMLIRSICTSPTIIRGAIEEEWEPISSFVIVSSHVVNLLRKMSKSSFWHYLARISLLLCVYTTEAKLNSSCLDSVPMLLLWNDAMLKSGPDKRWRSWKCWVWKLISRHRLVLQSITSPRT